jgi:hypothetical protein
VYSKRLEAGLSAERPQDHSVASEGAAPASVPVTQLVELVYQRLQQDRPAYDSDNVGPPAYDLDSGTQTAVERQPPARPY